MRDRSEEWVCVDCHCLQWVPGSARWPAPSGVVTMWCKSCGGNGPFRRAV